MDDSIDSILNGEPAEEPTEAPAIVPEPEAEAAPEQPRDGHGRFAPKGEQEPAPAAEAAPAESAPPAPANDDSPTVPRRALLDERNKRQTLEQQIAELNARINQFQQAPPQPPPDPILDPESHSAYVVEQASEAAEQRAIAAVQRHHVMMSAEAAKVKYPDYLDKVQVFQDLAAVNPALNAQMLQHPNPAEYAYSVAKQHEELSQYGSLEARDAAMKAKWEAEALEKLKAQVPAQSVPQTIAGDRSIGARTGPAWSGPASMEDLLGH